MHLTLDSLLVLDAIDRGGSFAAGAEELLRVPSAVSYTVQKLEQDIGVVIFDRSGYRAKLTAAGSQLLKDGRELLRTAEQIERRAKAIGAGGEAQLAIAVGGLVPLGAVYALLRAFFDAPANRSTHLRITTETQAIHWQTLLAGQSDIIIGAPEREATPLGIRTRLLGEVELALVVPSAHQLARVPEPLSPQMILPYRVVRQMESPFEDSPECVVSDLLAVDDYPSQVEAIRQGLGIGYVPPHLVREDVEGGRLVTKVVADAPRLRLVVAWRVTGVGAGLQWLLEQLEDETIRAELIPRNARNSEIGNLLVSRAMHARHNHASLRQERRGPHELEVRSSG